MNKEALSLDFCFVGCLSGCYVFVSGGAVVITAAAARELLAALNFEGALELKIARRVQDDFLHSDTGNKNNYGTYRGGGLGDNQCSWDLQLDPPLGSWKTWGSLCLG